MAARKGNAKGRAWKLERASVHHPKRGAAKARSNKYSASDADTKPAKGERARFWVGGYTRKDGTKVAGHYRVATPA